MKAAFVHDHIFYRVEDQVYSRGGLPYDIWARYLKYFDEIVVMGRVGQAKSLSNNKLVKSSGTGVSFKLHPYYRNPKDYFLHKKKLREPIKELVEEVDVCIIRLASVLGTLVVEECIRQNKPWMAEVVACGWGVVWHYGNIKGKLFAPIMYGMNKRCIRKADYAIYVSKSFLQKRYPCKGVTASVSDVNITHIEEAILEKRLQRIKSREKDQPIVLGLVGSLDVAYKGHRTAIKAIKRLRDEGYNVKLRCLGGGNKERWLKVCKQLGIEDYVEFSGGLPAGEAVLEWLDYIDIFIMPSMTEGFPRSLVEALSRGCASIGANRGGIVELIDKSWRIHPKDYRTLANKVIEMIEDEEILVEQAKINFKRAKAYERSKLDGGRDMFFKEFVAYCNHH